MKTLLIRNVDPDLHRIAKTLAAERAITLDQLVKDAIREYCLLLTVKKMENGKN